MGPNTLTFSDASFDQDVLRSDVPVLVDFWAEWCGPCRQIAPAIDAIATEYAGKAKVGKVDVDANRHALQRAGHSHAVAVQRRPGGGAARRRGGQGRDPEDDRRAHGRPSTSQVIDGVCFSLPPAEGRGFRPHEALLSSVAPGPSY